MIPEARKDAVERALRDAFGVTEFEDIRMMTAGLSPALIFRIVVQRNPYLLRIITKTDAAIGPGRGDQTNHFTRMKLAAEVGIAPRVWYTNAGDGVSITDFVETRPFSVKEAAGRLAATIRTVHALPALRFPRTVNYLDAMDGFVRKFQAANILPESEVEQFFEGYARVTNVYPRDEPDMVPSHNDLKPENILFDGHRVWLVDWEAAFVNDRYVDLAVVANFVVTNDVEEDAYLRTYFGEAAGEYRRARFYLMRQLLHMFYTVVLTMVGLKGKPIDSNESVPEFRDFHNRIQAGEVSLATEESKAQYARVHLKQVLQNTRAARFEDALRIVSDRHGL